MGKKYQPSAKSLANLRPAKPGEVRNPLGINRGRTYSDEYEEIANAPLPEKLRRKYNKQLGEQILPKGTTWARGIAGRLHIGAVIEGNPADAKELADHVEGKATQRVEVTGAEGRDLIPGGDLDSLTDEQL